MVSMACAKPMVAYQTRSRTASGKFRFRFLCKATSFTGTWGPHLKLMPCRQCILCRLEQSRQTASRLVLELKAHPHAGFLTLTYDDDHLPEGQTLVPRHWTLFAKKLRSRFTEAELGKLKFFGVGEYGEKSGRPHYHAIVYSETPLMVEQVENSRTGHPQFIHPEIAEAWTYGMHRVSEVTFESAAYTARYALKKICGPTSDEHYQGRVKEFVRYPKRLARAYFEEWVHDIYPRDSINLPDRGNFTPPPYYDRLLEKFDPQLLRKIKLRRELKRDIAETEAEWFGLINDNNRSERVQQLRQQAFSPRGIV